MSAGRLAARALDYCFALRPLLWIPAVALYEAGRIGAGRPGALGAASGGRPLTKSDAISLGALLLVLAFVHIANGWEGRESDRANEKGWPVAGAAIRGRVLLALATAALLLALFLAMWLGTGARACLAAALLLGLAYVTPWIVLKRRAGLDVAANALGYGGIAFSLGAIGPKASLAQAAASAGSVLGSAMPYVLGVATITLLTMMADRVGDQSVGVRTSAVVLGTARAAALAVALAWGTALAGLLARDVVAALWGALAGAALPWSDPFAGSETWNRLARVGQVALMMLLLLTGSWLAMGFAVAVAAIAAPYYGARTGRIYPLSEACGGT